MVLAEAVMVSFISAPVTASSRLSYPTELTTSVLPTGALMVNCPLAFVWTELLVPFTVTVAPARGSPVEERRVPLTACCAKPTRVRSKAAKMDRRRNRFFMFIAVYCIKNLLFRLSAGRVGFQGGIADGLFLSQAGVPEDQLRFQHMFPGFGIIKIALCRQFKKQTRGFFSHPDRLLVNRGQRRRYI